MKKRKDELSDLKRKIEKNLNLISKGKSPDLKSLSKLLREVNELQIDPSLNSDNLFRTTLYSIGDAVITTDIKGFIQQMNPIAEKLSGWKEAEARNKPIEKVFNTISESTGKKTVSSFKKVIATGKIIGLKNRTLLKSKSGNKIPIADSCAPIINDNKKIVGVVLVFRDQTNEREIQNSLEERERKYSTLLTNLPGFTYRCANDKNWTMEYISEGCKKITGYAPNDFISNKILFNDLILPEYRTLIWKKWQKILKEKSFFEFEYPIKTKNGNQKWIWERGRGVYSGKGKLLFLEGFIEDVTEQKRTEELLKESESRYRAFFDNSPDAIFLADSESGKILDANREALRLLKIPYSKVIKMHQSQLHPKRLKTYSTKFFKEQIKAIDLKIPIEHYLVTATGEEIPIEILASTLTLNGKTIVQGVFRNISERRRMEAALLNSQQMLQNVLEQFPGVVFWKNVDSVYLGCNTAFAKAAGFNEPIDIIGKTDFDFPWRVTEADSYIADDKLVIDSGKPKFHIIETQHRPDNSITWLDTSKTPLRDNHGKIIGVLGISNDITDRVKSEQALQKSEEKFRSLFELSTDPMLLLDGEVFFDCNNAALELMGCKTKDQLLFISPANLSPEFQPDGLSSKIKAQKLIDQAFKEGVARFEWVHRKISGVEFPVEVMLTTIPLDGKQILFTIWRDITERKAIELEIQRSRDRMQLLVEGTPNLFFYVQNINKDIKYISPSVELITGHPVGKWLNQNHWFLTDSPLNLIARERTVAHLSGQVITDPIFAELQHADGSKVMCEIYERPIIKNDKVVGLQGVAHDITNRLEIEKNLREIELSYSRLFDSVSEAIYILNENGVFLDVNKGALNMYGYTREELIGKTPEYVGATNKNDLPFVVNALEKAFNGEKQQIEFWGKRKNGEEFLKDVHLYPGNYFNKKVIIAIANDITERKKIEDALALSEERYRAISNLTSDYLFSTQVDENGEHTVVWIAGSFEKITGYTVEEYKKIGGWRAILHPDDIKLDDSDLSKLQKNEKVNREIRTYHKNGHLVWVKSYAQPIWDSKNNKMLGVYGAVEDITNRKQTEIIQKIQFNIANAVVSYKTLTELFESIRQELSEIINVNNFFIALYDEKSGMLRSDVDKDEVEEIAEWAAKGSMTGYVIEQKKSQLLTKEEINELINAGTAGMIGVIPEVWLGVPFKISGKVIGVLVVQSYNDKKAYDASSIEILEIVAHELSIYIKHKKAEEETIKLSVAIVQSPVSIIISDPKGNIEYVNPKFTEISGYSLEEVKGKNPKILNSGEHSKEFFTDLWNTIIAGKNWQGEIRNRKKDGSLYWENAIISPIINNEGIITNYIAVKEDVTEKKKMIEELIDAKEKAEEMNRIKSSFFANMSHELRTPMVGILGFSEFLMNELKDNPNYYSMVNSINVSGHRLLETLNLILNLSKLEASKVEVNLEIKNIIPLIEESFGFFESAAAKKGIEYIFVKNDKEIICKVDILLLSSILNNLINNAIKFTDSGSVTVTTSIEDDTAEISVTDTGVGISEKKQNLIWEEFRQASEGYNRGFEGTGLGLTIAKKYTDLMNGSISVKSMLNKGTTFTVRFPLVNKITNQIPQTKKEDADKLPELTSTRPSVRILYVEDDEISVKYVATITKSFYIVDSAKDSDEALNKIKQFKYDAILMDINLRRGMDGIELTKVIRKIDGYQTVPIIAITAFAMGQEKEVFLSKGMTHYLSKPFVKAQLFNLLESALDKK